MKDRIKKALIVAAFILGGVLIGSVQLLPFLEQVPIGHRQGTVLTDSADSAEKMLSDLGGFFKIYRFKTAMNIEYFLEYAPFHLSIGIYGAILAVLGILMGVIKKNNTVLLFTGLLVFGLLWMWGSWPHQVLSAISSIFKGLRPTYFISIPLFVAPILSAYGFSYTTQGLKWLSDRTRNRLKITPQLRLYGGIALISAGFIGMAIYSVLTTIPSQRYKVGNFDTLLYTLLPILIAVIAHLSFELKFARYSLMALVLFVFLQGSALFAATQPIAPKKLYYAGNPYYESILKDSKTKNPHNVRTVYPFSPQTSMFYGLGALNGYDALYAKSTEDLIDAINYPVKTVKYSERSRNAIYVNNTQKENVLKTLGVEYIITDEKRAPPVGYHLIYSGTRNDVYRSSTPAQQIYFARTVSRASTEDQLIKIKSNTLGYREVAMETTVSQPSIDDKASVNFDIGINSINITTQTDKERVLFVGQTYRPQWVAILDGRTQLKISKANYGFMAITVPAGNHSIIFRYMPKSYQYGVAITLTAAMVALLVAVIPTLRTRKQK